MISTDSFVREPHRQVPVAMECDICVVGGSCTGVFAAIRAARLGYSVAIVESNILFGGMATAAQVNEWHSLHDSTETVRIIGGLTGEVLAKLEKKNAVRTLRRQCRGPYHLFNSAELALELDELVRSHKVRPFLKALCAGAVREGNRLTAVVIEDKSGRRAIKARMFIDASGDGDLLRRAGFAAWKNEHLQPVTYQALIAGINSIPPVEGGMWEYLAPLLQQYGYPKENSRPWMNSCGFDADIRNVYGPRLNGVDASDADQLTSALLESRRCHAVLLEMFRKELGGQSACVALAHSMGVRETWHASCLHRVRASELLAGVYFEDAIAFGTYPVDVHSKDGTMLRYMDGRQEQVAKDGSVKWSRWREELKEAPAFYSIPYRSLVPQISENLVVAGRFLDADREAFGGLRVMVNMNQTGEAAGTAACLAIEEEVPPARINVSRLRALLVENGSLFPSPPCCRSAARVEAPTPM